MKKYQIHLDDLQRIFFGEAPPEFFIEIIIRTILIYIILISSMRLMGQRMASQLNRIEMAAMVSLAAAIGVPLQVPDRGILPAVMIAAVVISVQRLVSFFTVKNQKFEEVSQGDLDILVEDGTVMLDKLKRTRITKDRLFSHLRSESLTHLGHVKRLYFEANGSFTLIKNHEARPGLCILPEWDTAFINQLLLTDTLICRNCGKEKDAGDSCTNCGTTVWDKGMMDKAAG